MFEEIILLIDLALTPLSAILSFNPSSSLKAVNGMTTLTDIPEKELEAEITNGGVFMRLENHKVKPFPTRNKLVKIIVLKIQF